MTAIADPCPQHDDHVGTYEMWKAFGRRSLFRSDCEGPTDTYDIELEQREGWVYDKY